VNSISLIFIPREDYEKAKAKTDVNRET